jgi:acetyl-CoA acetyltransferase
MDLAEVHDCVTMAEILRMEKLGLCNPWGGGHMIDESRTEIGGNFLINPSGGLLTRGHRFGATGIAQVVEIVWHLREEAGRRQITGANVGLTHCRGGSAAGTEGGC